MEQTLDQAAIELAQKLSLRLPVSQTTPLSSAEQQETQLNQLWCELYRRAFQSELIRANSKVGVAEQNREAKDPSFYADTDRTSLFLTQERLQSFQQSGLAIVDHVISKDLLHSVWAEANTLLEGEWMKNNFQQDVATRFDKIIWLDEEEVLKGNREDNTHFPLCPGLDQCIRLIKSVAHELKQHLGLDIVVPRHCMLAVYDGDGAHYVAHRDNVCNLEGTECDNSRAITVLLYLNPEWDESFGGWLRCHPHVPLGEDSVCNCPPTVSASSSSSSSSKANCEHLDVAPVGARLAIFRSQELLHEVMPTFKRRVALSCWLLAKQ